MPDRPYLNEDIAQLTATRDRSGAYQAEEDRQATPWESARRDQKDALGELHDAISEMGVRLRPVSCERIEKMQDDPRISVAHSELVTDMYAVTDGMRAGIARIRELTSSLDL